MKTSRYRTLERAIAAHDSGGIWDRWRFGRMLLVDNEATTPEGRLRRGVLEELITASARDGRRLHEREIQRRLQAGRAYPTEAQIATVRSEYETWWDLRMANFPEVEAPEGALSYDPRTDAQLTHDYNAKGARLLPHDEQLTFDLFPESKFDDDSLLEQLAAYTRDQHEMTARFLARDARRQEYLDQLVEAAGGDMTMTFGAARALLRESAS